MVVRSTAPLYRGKHVAWGLLGAVFWKTPSPARSLVAAGVLDHLAVVGQRARRRDDDIGVDIDLRPPADDVDEGNSLDEESDGGGDDGSSGARGDRRRRGCDDGGGSTDNNDDEG